MSTPLKPVSFLESDRATRERTGLILRRAQGLIGRINRERDAQKLHTLVQFAAAGRKVHVRGICSYGKEWGFQGFLERIGGNLFRVLSTLEQGVQVGVFVVADFEEIEQIEE